MGADTEQSALGMYSERSTKISVFRRPQEKIVEKGAIAQLAGRRLWPAVLRFRVAILGLGPHYNVARYNLHSFH